MKTILVPTDFSNDALQALESALSLASNNHAEVILLHVHKVVSVASVDAVAGIPVSYNISPAAEEAAMKAEANKLEALKGKYSNQGITITTKIVKDYSPGSIDPDLILQIPSDMIIMGTRGHSIIENIIVGSNTLNLVRESDRPVLVVKKKPLSDKVLNLLVPVDFEAWSPAISKAILGFATSFGAKIHLCYVHLPGAVGFMTTQDVLKKSEAFAKKHHLIDYTIDLVNDLTEEQGILFCAEMRKADVIIMPTHGRSGLDRFFKGSVTENVLQDSHFPVLTLSLKTR